MNLFQLTINEKLNLAAKTDDEMILNILSANQRRDIRAMVAKNKNTPKYIIDKLCYDQTIHVRAACAGRFDLDDKMIETLSCDRSWFVIMNLIHINKRNRNDVSISVLERIWFSDYSWNRIPRRHFLMDLIRFAILERRNLSDAVLQDAINNYGHLEHFASRLVWRMSADQITSAIDDPKYSIGTIGRIAAGRYHTGTSPDIIYKLYNKYYNNIRIMKCLAYNKNTPVSILKNLMSYDDECLQKYAKEAIMRRKYKNFI